MDAYPGIGNERGVALPMAMLTLLLLTTLMLAFAVLSQTEPIIASNHLRVSQARSLAESGFERGVWALSQGHAVAPVACALPCLSQPLPDTPNPVTADTPVVAPEPYDGTTFFPVGTTGGFTIRIVAPRPLTAPLDRDITAVGWTPTNDVTDARTKAHRQISGTVQALPDLALRAPCVLCVRGDVEVRGGWLIDSTTDGNCGGPLKTGAYTAGNLLRHGSSEIKGQGGAPPWNVEGVDYKKNQTITTFDSITFSSGNMKTFRDLAKRNGTYFGPGSPNGTPAAGPAYDPSITFNSSNRVKNGIVFVDTLHGTDITPATPWSEFASVTIHGNPFEAGEFIGYLIVNGRLDISGGMAIKGLVYAVDNLTYNGTGQGGIEGLVISHNVRDGNATTVSDTDSSAAGASRIRLNCANARASSLVPKTFQLLGGTHREHSD